MAMRTLFCLQHFGFRLWRVYFQQYTCGHTWDSDIKIDISFLFAASFSVPSSWLFRTKRYRLLTLSALRPLVSPCYSICVVVNWVWVVGRKYREKSMTWKYLYFHLTDFRMTSVVFQKDLGKIPRRRPSETDTLFLIYLPPCVLLRSTTVVL
jgi:hypothetical protein